MIQSHGDIKICVISVWFGQWPSYFPYFLKTCVSNKFIDWIIVSDQEIQGGASENLSFIKMTKQSFVETASKKLGFDINLKSPYKLCDFKPAFGKIFEDLLSPYQYWGYCDIDLVFGDIKKHFDILMDEEPDIISGYHNFMAGPFSLYHNSPAINNLFRDCTDHQQILQYPVHRAFDENIPRKIPLKRKIYYRILYLVRLMTIGPRYHLCIPEVRYNFQWYIKKRISHKSFPQDMTELVYKAAHEKSIKAIFSDLIRSDRAFRRQGQKYWAISWQDGKLTDNKTGEDLCAFHFIDSKDKPGFVITPCAVDAERFTVTEKKIECE